LAFKDTQINFNDIQINFYDTQINSNDTHAKTVCAKTGKSTTKLTARDSHIRTKIRSYNTTTQLELVVQLSQRDRAARKNIEYLYSPGTSGINTNKQT